MATKAQNNTELRVIFEKMVMDNAIPYISNFINEHNFSINTNTDNYIDMGNEVAFNIFKYAYVCGVEK